MEKHNEVMADIRILVLFPAFLLAVAPTAKAQSPFVEGKITYAVKLTTADQKEYEGTYKYTLKGGNLKKELSLAIYQETFLINTSAGTAYALKTSHGRKYAIQVDIEDLKKEQLRYDGFTFNTKGGKGKSIAGLNSKDGEIVYMDGSRVNILYSDQWYPNIPLTFERFPDVKILPLVFYYKDPNGVTMKFEAKEVSAVPVENSEFSIPTDYKVISSEEYKRAK